MFQINNKIAITIYYIFPNISWFKYQLSVRFSFKNLSKIENLTKYVKNKILPCRKKKKFSQKSENVPNLQVMQKKTCVSHPRSNKTAHTVCLTSWVALIGCKIKSQWAAIVLIVVTLYWARCTAFLVHTCKCVGIHYLNF